ncbi:MAG: hypothetical protein HZB47_12970 [Nitrosomonadales bacterium]|nr:hypothetical protein [Nitrosomonadales bacterium]
MSDSQDRSMHFIKKHVLRVVGATLLIVPTLSLAANDLLLNEDSLAARIAKEPNCQLLDARSAEAQRLSPLAFSTRYDKTAPVRRGLVFVVADSDEAALEIVRSIPADAGRSVYAVQGGADAWKRVQSETATAIEPTSFVVPKGTCDLGKPSLKFDAKSSKKTGKAALEPINK